MLSKDQIESVIDTKGKDSFLGHWESISCHNGLIVGEINNKNFKIWNFNRFWTGIFHPVIYGEFNHSKGNVKIKAKLNILGKIFIRTLQTLLVISLNYSSLLQLNFKKMDLISIIISIIIALLIGLAPWASVKSGKKSLLKEINKRLLTQV